MRNKIIPLTGITAYILSQHKRRKAEREKNFIEWQKIPFPLTDSIMVQVNKIFGSERKTNENP